MISQSSRITGHGSKLPAPLSTHEPDDIIAWHHEVPVRKHRLLCDVYSIASRLPDGKYAINLCEDRYWFLASFLAALLKKQANLLPPGRANAVIGEIAQEYSGAYCMTDTDFTAPHAPVFRVDRPVANSREIPGTLPEISEDLLAAIVFTSGSTGTATANLKYWKDLITGARLAQQRFGFGMHRMRQTIVATVPPQHMYGLETSILNTLINGVNVYTGKTFYPADILHALKIVPEPRILVTTPIHLRSCLDSDLAWPTIDYVISATAPLDPALASRAENILNCPVLEIYGCTEAGSIASRRTTDGDTWTLYEGTLLRARDRGYSASGPDLPADIQLHDIIVPLNQRQFNLRGRFTDMINIAGKRASLEDLNTRLRSIEGVVDAAFLVPEEKNNNLTRLTAFVIAPTRSREDIRKELEQLIDPVFLPRPMHMVSDLPRNDTGKLPRSALLELLETVRKAG